MHDAKIGIISLIWSALVVINYIFAEENWKLYSSKKEQLDLVICVLEG